MSTVSIHLELLQERNRRQLAKNLAAELQFCTSVQILVNQKVGVAKSVFKGVSSRQR